MTDKIDSSSIRQVKAVTVASEESREKFVGDLHLHMWANLTFAEQKAAFVFLTSSGILVYLNQIGATTRWLVSPCRWRFAEVSSFFSVIGLLACAIMILLVVVPRTSGNSSGLVFWRSIAQKPNANAFASAICSRTKEELEAEMIQHIYELSKICDSKFTWIRRAMWAGSIGAIFSFLYIAFVKR